MIRAHFAVNLRVAGQWIDRIPWGGLNFIKINRSLLSLCPTLPRVGGSGRKKKVVYLTFIKVLSISSVVEITFELA
jgi:hypothetical protein